MNLADPMTEDPRIQLDREDEALREQLWADFVGWLHPAQVPTLLRNVADLMSGQRDPYHIPLVVQQPILAFAETEGWPSVLNAIARVLKEQADGSR